MGGYEGDDMMLEAAGQSENWSRGRYYFGEMAPIFTLAHNTGDEVTRYGVLEVWLRLSMIISAGVANSSASGSQRQPPRRDAASHILQRLLRACAWCEHMRARKTHARSYRSHIHEVTRHMPCQACAPVRGVEGAMKRSAFEAARRKSERDVWLLSHRN